MNLAVTVLHYVRYADRDAGDGDHHHAHTFQVMADNVDLAADVVYTLANVDNEDMLPANLRLYGPQVKHYRERMNRSMTVGDILVMEALSEDTARIAAVLGCQPTGWTKLDIQPEYDTTAGNHSQVSESYQAFWQG